MSDWKVVYTERAEQDLRDIFENIAFSLLQPETAQGQARRIMDAIEKLNALPMRFRLYDKEPWRSKGLRVLPVDHFVAFYLPVEQQGLVAILRIMFGGRNIEEQLKKTASLDLPH